MSRPEIKTAAQLKGGSVAIANFGGQAVFLSRIALQKLGLNPLKDVTIVQIGTIPERLSALATGKVQAAMLNSPDNRCSTQPQSFRERLSNRKAEAGGRDYDAVRSPLFR